MEKRVRLYYDKDNPQIRIERELKEKLVTLQKELKELGIYLSLKNLVCGILETTNFEELKEYIIKVAKSKTKS